MTADERIPVLDERLHALTARAEALRLRVERAESGRDGSHALGVVGLALTCGSLLLPWGRAAEPRERILAASLKDVERYTAIAPSALLVLAAALAVAWLSFLLLDRWSRPLLPVFGAVLCATLLVGLPVANHLTPGGATAGTYVAGTGLLLAGVRVIRPPQQPAGRRLRRAKRHEA